jgi:CheY-like chemotaxis protein
MIYGDPGGPLVGESSAAVLRRIYDARLWRNLPSGRGLRIGLTTFEYKDLATLRAAIGEVTAAPGARPGYRGLAVFANDQVSGPGRNPRLSRRDLPRAAGLRCGRAHPHADRAAPQRGAGDGRWLESCWRKRSRRSPPWWPSSSPNSGHQVVRVVDGEAALAAAERDRPDVIILDVRMPLPDGFAVLGRLKANPDPAVIMLTARGQERDVLWGLQAGATDYIVKPSSLKELLARVDVALRRRSGGASAAPPAPPLDSRGPVW